MYLPSKIPSPHRDVIPLGKPGTGRLPTSFSDPISSPIHLLEPLSCDIYDQKASHILFLVFLAEDIQLLRVHGENIEWRK